ncbi:MAG TPA: sigma-54 dependent transcriptional regulator [Ignavibacteriaceae bacterium]|nr:sigma-54 dependent transcriptional regulator [Ignavibacteriaceae bacterium]
MYNNSILIVDDETSYLELMKGLINDEGYKYVYTEQDPLKVLDAIERKYIDLVLCDVYMPQMNGMELLEKIIQKYPSLPVIMVTAINDVKIALKAIDQGAYEFITKPPDIDRLFLTIKRALEKRLLDLERNALREVSNIQEKKFTKDFSDIITNSKQMHKVFELVEIFAPTNETVLITGETGTGKDLIAKKIHDLSPRNSKPMVVVNLASISPSLFESELFGHERGSFTGATNEKIGYFESANGSTIFLDEIGELPKELQGKLLRTIQYNEIYRIGSSKPIKLNTRIIAATNKDLSEAISKEEFRTDLYYRLTRGFINLPPLRERGTDIGLLANYFLTAGNMIYNKNIHGFSEEIEKLLNHYTFPGNVRELENVILNAVAKTDDHSLITKVELPSEKLKTKTPKTHSTLQKLHTIEEAIKEHIRFVINHTNGNVQKAASILGVSERTLQRRLQQMRNEK